MHRTTALIGAIAALMLLAAPAAARPPASDVAAVHDLTGSDRVIIRAGADAPPAGFGARRTQSGSMVNLSPTPVSDIQVQFVGNFPAGAQSAFEDAATTWEHIVVSNRVIKVRASWEALGPGILGGAGPNNIVLANDGFAYPIALAEAKRDRNLNGTDYEIDSAFNSQFNNWDYNPENGTSGYDFYSVVLHELGHGLGFYSSFEVFNGRGYWGYGFGEPYPLRFDSFERTALTGGYSLLNENRYPMGSVALRNQLVDGGVFFAGPNAIAAAGQRPKLYAPSPWEQGSSNSHLDEAKYNGGVESLMTPALGSGEYEPLPGAITIAMLQDIGWQVAGAEPPSGPANDDFAAAKPVALGSSTTIQTSGATLQTGEPTPTCNATAAGSVWFKWSPGVNRAGVVAQTAGSTYDTVLAIYTGSSVESLAELGCNDDRGALNEKSRIQFDATAGTTYYFQATGAGGAAGSLQFTVKLP
jgi:hypothetical protein